eukprot:gb/GEZN01002695.1/.p1 GENE.gb/GEZN01002695.1/~~gb/GEZN01002695.1/.p1  ORF type:complete len:607 (+),score=64.70 gb/GEZN01002695.1/:100-1920(+)
MSKLEQLWKRAFCNYRKMCFRDKRLYCFLLLLPLILLILGIWMFLHSMLAVNLAHIALVGVCAIYAPTVQFRLLAVAVVRPILVVLLHYIFPYPRRRRWFAIMLVCVGETVLFCLWIHDIEHWFPALVASCWLLLLSESWIPTSQKHMKEAEQALLRAHGISAKCTTVADLSTLEIMPPISYRVDGSPESGLQPDRPVLLLCHGYASGKALWGPTLSELAKHFRVYTVDWLGFARSSRRRAFVASNVEQTHDYFVESLEQWRKAMGLEKFALLGHSFGGYICGIYAVRYPSRITRLYLASPVGIPHKPETPKSQMSITFRVLGVLWDWGLTPIQLIRFLGPVGPYFMRFISRLRWGNWLTPAQVTATADYIWHVNAGPVCSDLSIVRLLRVGAWSRQALGPILTQLQVPVTFLYGESDWMGYEHSLPVVDALHQQRRRQVRKAWDQRKEGAPSPFKSPSQDSKEVQDEGASTQDNLFNGHARVYLVREAGHQLFIMNGLTCARIVIHDAAVLPGVPKGALLPGAAQARSRLEDDDTGLAPDLSLVREAGGTHTQHNGTHGHLINSGVQSHGVDEPLLHSYMFEQEESERLLTYERMPEVHPGLYRV